MIPVLAHDKDLTCSRYAPRKSGEFTAIEIGADEFHILWLPHVIGTIQPRLVWRTPNKTSDDRTHVLQEFQVVSSCARVSTVNTILPLRELGCKIAPDTIQVPGVVRDSVGRL